MLRLDADDPVAAWQERMKAIVASADRLTERRFDAIHLKGPATDLTIGLLPSSTWLGANFTTVDGLVHHPNLPSEEIFTTPDPAARRRSRLLDDAARALRVPHGRHPPRVRGGRAVKADAEEGVDALRSTIAKDEGASRLGELALVDKEGRIGPLRTVFYDTLIDENAASHLALGNAYTFPVEDASDRERVNRSYVHVDFMVGSNDMDVDGTHARRRARAGATRRFLAALSGLADRDAVEPLADLRRRSPRSSSRGSAAALSRPKTRSKRAVVR